MDFQSLNPHIRFVNIFSYFPKEDVFVCGYDYRLFYITDGCLFLNFKDSSFTLSKHSLVLIPPEYPYKLTAADENGCELLCLNFDAGKDNLSENSVHPSPENEFIKENVFEKERIPELSRPIFMQEATELSDRLHKTLRLQKKRGVTSGIGYCFCCQNNYGASQKRGIACKVCQRISYDEPVR